VFKVLFSLFRRKPDNGEAAEMSFIQHIDELRGHLFRSAIATVIGAVIVWYNDNFIIKKILMGPTHSDFITYTFLCKLSQKFNLGSDLCLQTITVKMQNTVVWGQFSVYFNIILIGGFILAFPYIFWEFWKFTRPALKPKELKNTRGVIFWVSFLFFVGILFGYLVVAPYTVNFFAKFSMDDIIENRWTIGSYFSTIVPLILASGLSFQMPLVIYFLAKLGVVNTAFLVKMRRYAILIIVILVSIITPPDMLSTIICSIPLVILYEISILLCKKVETRNRKNSPAEWS
jgi:sec-independent protein translocase protein TatC